MNQQTKALQKLSETVKTRNSNLELLRIILMLFIIAHHYIINSGIVEIIESHPYYYAKDVIASTTFGVFLIHTNGELMRKWLWGDLFKNVKFF